MTEFPEYLFYFFDLAMCKRKIFFAVWNKTIGVLGITVLPTNFKVKFAQFFWKIATLERIVYVEICKIVNRPSWEH